MIYIPRKHLILYFLKGIRIFTTIFETGQQKILCNKAGIFISQIIKAMILLN